MKVACRKRGQAGKESFSIYCIISKTLQHFLHNIIEVICAGVNLEMKQGMYLNIVLSFLFLGDAGEMEKSLAKFAKVRHSFFFIVKQFYHVIC